MHQSRKGYSLPLANYLDFGYSHPTMWCLRGPFHDTRGKASKTKQKQNKGIKRKHQLHTSPSGNGRKASLTKSWSFTDLHVRGIRRWNPSLGTKCRLCFPSGCTRALVLPPYAAHPMLLLVWWAGSEPCWGRDRAQMVGSGIYLRLALAPAQKTLSGKTVTKCHDFHSS